MSELIGAAFIVLGLIFSLVGTYSLVRLSDFYSGLSASIKGVAFGAFLTLFGSFLISPASSEGLKSLLCALFLLGTAPVVAHAIARGERIYEKNKKAKVSGRRSK